MYTVLLSVVTLLFLWIIRGFYVPIISALILSIVFIPTHKRWMKLTRLRKSLSSLLTVFTILLFVAIPLVISGIFVFKQTQGFYQQFIQVKTTKEVELDLIDATSDLTTRLGVGLDPDYYNAKLSEGVISFTKWISDQTLAVGQNTIVFGFNAFVALYLTFVVLNNSKKIRASLIRLSPIEDGVITLLLHKIITITRAVIKGTLFVGAIQGIIGGVLFWVAGINTAVIWGFLMILLSIIPLVGSGIIWFPAGLILILSGSFWQGMLIILGGVFIISTIDNILRPKLIGRSVELPDSLILISTLGGIASFGIIGFVIGPVVAGVFFSLWEIFGEKYAVLSKKH